MKHTHLSGRIVSAESKSLRLLLPAFQRKALLGHKTEVRWSLPRAVLVHCLFQLQKQISHDGSESESSTGKVFEYKSRATQRMGLAEGLGMRGQRRRPHLSFLNLKYILYSKINVKDYLRTEKILRLPKKQIMDPHPSQMGQADSGGRLMAREACLP